MAQVSEADASGAIADVFADYRAITGFAQTPLILRELASHGAAVCIPAWNAIRALYEPQSFGCVPSVLTAGLRLPPISLDTALVRPDFERIAGESRNGPSGAGIAIGRLRATFEQFAAANAVNLVIVHHLASLAGDVGSTRSETMTVELARPQHDANRSNSEARFDPLQHVDPHAIEPERVEEVMSVAERLLDHVPEDWRPTLLLVLTPYPALLRAVTAFVSEQSSLLRSHARVVDDRAADLAIRHRGPRGPVLDEGVADALRKLSARYLLVLPAFTVLAACPLIASESVK